MAVVKLNSSHRNQIENLTSQRRTLFKSIEIDTTPNLDLVFQNNERGEPENERWSAYGLFDTSENLTGIAFSYLWKNLPYYTVLGEYLHNPSKSPRLYKMFVSELLNTMLAEMESRGRLTFYTATLLRQSHLDVVGTSPELSHHTSYLSMYSRYENCIEKIIPSGAVPLESSYLEMIGNRPWPVTLCIRRYSLKNEFRLQNQGLVTARNSANGQVE